MTAVFDESTMTWDYVAPDATGSPKVTTVPLPWLIRVGGSWTRDGLLIDHVTPGGPATRTTDSGDRVRHALEPGDTITSLNDLAVLDNRDWIHGIMTALDPSRIRLTVLRLGAPYDWMIAPQWRASATLPQPIMPAPAASWSRFGRVAFEDQCRAAGLPADNVKAVCDRMESAVQAAATVSRTMSDRERAALLGVFAPTAPPTALALGDNPASLIPGLKIGRNPFIPPGRLPSVPDITRPEKWFPNPADAIETIGERTREGLASWAEGVGDGVVEAIGQLVGKMAHGTALVFSNACAHLDDMFGHLRTVTAEGNSADQRWFGFKDAVLSLCHAAGGLVVDASEQLSAAVLDVVVDVVAGVLPAVAAARPLTQSERDFAHSIFHGQINVSHVRLAFHPAASGLVAANVIWLPRLDLRRMGDRSRFAHELTHVYQDQDISSPGTQEAAKEFLRHRVLGEDPYKLNLRQGMTWEDLGMEQQAELVGLWSRALDTSLPNLEDRQPYRFPAEEQPIAEAIIKQRAFF